MSEWLDPSAQNLEMYINTTKQIRTQTKKLQKAYRLTGEIQETDEMQPTKSCHMIFVQILTFLPSFGEDGLHKSSKSPKGLEFFL